MLHQEGVPLLHRGRKPKQPKLYSRPIPGDRVQLDTFKVAPGLYQYTATDDCTRVRVLGLYSARTARNAVHFLEEWLLEEFPFPIQRIQTDRGGEFFGLVFQKALRQHCIKFRPIPPRSPHLNGKVERSQQTDWIEFYATADLRDPELEDRLGEWQFFYNWHRPHSSLSGKTPMERCCELHEQTPLRWTVCEAYEFAPLEEYRERDFQQDLRIRRLKRSL